MLGAKQLTMHPKLPVLNWDFSLLPSTEKLAWEQSLPEHLLQVIKPKEDASYPKWKHEEQLAVMKITVSQLIENGVIDIKQIENLIINKVGKHEYGSANKSI